jgi:hypothetical protein
MDRASTAVARNSSSAGRAAASRRLFHRAMNFLREPGSQGRDCSVKGKHG